MIKKLGTTVYKCMFKIFNWTAWTQQMIWVNLKDINDQTCTHTQIVGIQLKNNHLTRRTLFLFTVDSLVSHSLIQSTQVTSVYPVQMGPSETQQISSYFFFFSYLGNATAICGKKYNKGNPTPEERRPNNKDCRRPRKQTNKTCLTFTQLYE